MNGLLDDGSRGMGEYSVRDLSRESKERRVRSARGHAHHERNSRLPNRESDVL